MARNNRPKIALTKEERDRLLAVVTKLGDRKAPAALRAGKATIEAAIAGDPILIDTRNRLIASLAAVETDLEDEG